MYFRDLRIQFKSLSIGTVNPYTSILWL